mmetsp:Transcript_11591/g.37151  ORF Transcript_11591/g.37151 Transcript_11591/m.37151 type:complete len:165 (-) Transcript_11591:368-862(-)
MFRRALLLRHSGRLLSSEARALTLEQAMTSSHLILSELESPQMVQAMQGAASQGDRLQKWQTANAVLIQATLRTLPQVGFSADAAGLHAYTEAFAAQARSPQPEVRSALAGVNVSKWRSSQSRAPSRAATWRTPSSRTSTSRASSRRADSATQSRSPTRCSSWR